MSASGIKPWRAQASQNIRATDGCGVYYSIKNSLGALLEALLDLQSSCSLIASFRVSVDLTIFVYVSVRA